MGLTINRWILISCINIIYTAICTGQLTLVSETVPFVNEPWILKCKADSLTGTVSITDPTGSTVGFCALSAPPFPASCSPNPGYALAINETEDTVTMTRTLTTSDNGTWMCEHSGDSESYVLQSPLLSRNFPQSKTDYFDHVMSATSGMIIDTTEVDHTFTFHYGCVSTNLKFEWTTVPGVPWDDTSDTASTTLTCVTNQAFKSTQPTSVILPKVTQDGSKLKVSVYVDGYYNLQAIEEYTFNVTFSASSTEGGGSRVIVIVLVIFLIILIICIIVVICCLFNKRCRSRYLRKKSKFIFTCPRKDITVIDNDLDNDFELERPEGSEIEIQCLRKEKGNYVHGDEPLHDDKGVRVRNNPCILFNTYFEINSLKKEHVGVYKYERASKTDKCSLTLKICPDLIITYKSIVHWAYKGEWLGLTPKKTSSDLHWIKTSFKNGKVIKTTSISKENRLVLKNINDKDAGSYHAVNAKEKWTSGCLTLKVVNYLVTVGEKDDSHVAVVRNSINLKFTECKLSSIQCLKWKKSELIDETKIRELESSSNFELILGEMTKEDEGLYWCEVLNKDGTSSKSGKLTLQVVNAIVNVGMKSASYSATIGDSIQIRWTKEIKPQHIKFTVKQNNTNQIAPRPQIKSITNNAYLLIEKISTEDEGCYQFESADAKSGVLTLSAMEGKEKNGTFYKGKSGLPTLQTRKGAKTTLDSIPDIRRDKKKKKKKKKNKNESNDELKEEIQIAYETTPEKNEIK